MLRSFWRFILICADITNTYLSKNGPQLSAAITYYALFSLIPLTLAIMFILGTFYQESESLELRLSLAVNTLMPVSRETVSEALESMASHRAVTGSLGIAGLIWVSTTVFGAMRKSVNTLWGISQPRRFFHEKLIDFAFTAGAGLLLVVPIALTAGAGVLWHFTSALRTGSVDGGGLSSLLLNILPPFFTLMAFMFIYRYLPNTRVTFREIWPATLLTALAFEGWKAVFLWYTRSFPVYDTMYGPVGALVALLTWIYISANILLVGALVTSRYSSYLSGRIEELGRLLLSALKGARGSRLSSPNPAKTGEND
jgi:membrane protein